VAKKTVIDMKNAPVLDPSTIPGTLGAAVKHAKTLDEKITAATKGSREAVAAKKQCSTTGKPTLEPVSTSSMSVAEAEVEEHQPLEAANADAPRIECHLLVGELSVPIDASSLEHTLGAGQWGYGRGLVDAWPDAAWVGLLTHLGLPADPLDRTTAAQPVKRLVQKLWYAAVKGGVPDERKVEFEARDVARVEEYKASFGHVKETAEGRSERAKTNFGKVRASIAESIYTPTAALKDKKFTGQQAPIFDFFKSTKFTAANLSQVAAGAAAAGLKTAKQTPERVAAFYLADWTKKGLLTRK
jgi:hypothetical protein